MKEEGGEGEGSISLAGFNSPQWQVCYGSVLEQYTGTSIFQSRQGKDILNKRYIHLITLQET